MAINRFVDRAAVSVAEVHLARVADDGCANHPHLAALSGATGRDAGRNLADFVHLLCSVHGRHPGLIQLALAQCPTGPAGEWLGQAADAFERERSFVLRLTAAVGPMPSTPGATETEASLTAQRHALEILAGSERCGCALGAATALVGDWWAVRRVLDHVAVRLGVTVPPPSLPDEASVIGVIGAASDTPASERALAFGAEQLLLQHRCLFDLLEARAEARVDS